MPDQMQDNVVRGNLRPSASAVTPPSPDAASPDQPASAADPSFGAPSAGDAPGLTIRVGGFSPRSASDLASDPVAGGNAGESVYVTTPGLAARREADQRQGETVGVRTPPDQDPVFTWHGYFQAIGLLLIMLVALWLGLRLLRRFGKGRFLPRTEPLSRDELYLEGNLSLGQNRSVCVVRFMDRRLVLGVTEQQINFLTEAGVDDAEEPGEEYRSGEPGVLSDASLSEADFTECMKKLGREGA